MTDPSAETAKLLQSLEEHLLQPTVRRDPDAIAALLADDFREFGSSGRIFTKSEIIFDVVSETPAEITMSDLQCQFPAPDVALLTYRSRRTTSIGAPIQALRSSLWVLRQSRWQMLFHQGTRL